MRVKISKTEGLLGTQLGIASIKSWIGSRAVYPSEGVERPIELVDEPALQSWAGQISGWRQISRASRMLCAVVKRLLTSSVNDEVGMAWGSIASSAGAIYAFEAKLREVGPALVNPLLFPETVPNAAAGNAAIRCQLRGPATTLTSGHLCGIAALEQALDWLADGRVTRIVSGGYEEIATWLPGRPELWQPWENTAPTTEGAAALLLSVEPTDSARGYLGRLARGCIEPGQAEESVRRTARQAMKAIESSQIDLVFVMYGDPRDLCGLEPQAVQRELGLHRASVTFSSLLGWCPGPAAAIATAVALEALAGGRTALIAAIGAADCTCWTVEKVG
jgi:hypothetical protein